MLQVDVLTVMSGWKERKSSLPLYAESIQEQGFLTGLSETQM